LVLLTQALIRAAKTSVPRTVYDIETKIYSSPYTRYWNFLFYWRKFGKICLFGTIFFKISYFRPFKIYLCV